MTDCVLSCLYGGLKDSCCLVWGNCKFHCLYLEEGVKDIKKTRHGRIKIRMGTCARLSFSLSTISTISQCFLLQPSQNIYNSCYDLFNAFTFNNFPRSQLSQLSFSVGSKTKQATDAFAVCLLLLSTGMHVSPL